MYNYFFLFLLFTLVACKQNKSLYYKSISTKTACLEKDGYWYEGKCWSGFEEAGFSVVEIDKEVEKQMAIIENAQIKVNGTTSPLILFFPEVDGNELTLITIFGEANQEKTILQTIKKKQLNNGNFTTDAILLNGNLMQISQEEESALNPFSNSIAVGKMKTTINDLDQLDFTFSGLLTNPEEEQSYQIDYKTHETITGAGTSVLEVKGDEIHLNGELGTRTYDQLKKAIANYPNAKTVVLGTIQGSLNDEVNMHTGRILREAGLNTKVLKTSSIASGGVDLFCAGKERIVEKGAKIGIHSWCCVDDLTAVELPKDHPAHQYQIAYFTMCMGKETGPDFYFHTLTSAPFDGVHWMNDEDIQKWKVATQWKEN